MIARVSDRAVRSVPVLDMAGIVSESDVEQKVLYPFLTNPSYAGIPPQWIRTKDYMVPTEIDKVSGNFGGMFLIT
jgi:hypothetical protein